MTDKEEIKEVEKDNIITGGALILSIAFDPHSGEFTTATNAIREVQFRTLSSILSEVKQLVDNQVLQLAELRMQSELSSKNGS